MKMKKFGRCYGCKRIVPIDVLRQVEFYDGHLHSGSFHHQTMCLTCIKKAEELGESMEEKMVIYPKNWEMTGIIENTADLKQVELIISKGLAAGRKYRFRIKEVKK